jgi:hypothetical protein
LKRQYINAIGKTWPNTTIIGCRFHLLQAWFRNLQKYSLVKDYENKQSEIGMWIRQTFALTYLDPQNVGDCFALYLFEEMPDDPRVRNYADYLTDTYISEDALFPPVIWAKNSACISRTTNTCEAFHRNFNDSMYQTHPNLFIFVEKLKEFQIDTYVKLQSIHLPAKINNINIKRKQKRIDCLIRKYIKNELSQFNLIKSIAFGWDE